MKSLNNFSDSEGDQWEVMQEFKISFKDVLLTVQLVCVYLPAPEMYFFVSDPPNKRTLMKRKLLSNGQTIWISNWSLEDATAFTDIIAKQTGLVLPVNETNNPFKYQGDITVTQYWSVLNDIKIIKAKAPFGNNIYYKVFLDDKVLTLVRMEAVQNLFEESWLPDEDTFLQPEDVKTLISLVKAFEKRNQWKKYN